MNIKKSLDMFAKKYGHCVIEEDIFDTIRGFAPTPRNFGDATYVATYAVKGHTFTKKYTMHKGQICIPPFGVEQQVIGTLCLPPLANTSLYEIKHFIDNYKRPIQGWSRKTLRNIEGILENHIALENNSAFFFAGHKPRATQQARLHQIWLQQFFTLGAEALDTITQEEAQLMKALFTQLVLTGNPQAIMRNSYHPHTDLYIPLSTDFLQAKVRLYQND